MLEAGNVEFVGNAVLSDDRKHPALTARWLRNALTAGRSAFEREMRRERRSLDEQFDRYWKESGTRQP